MRIGHVEIKVRQYADGRWGFDDYSRGPRHKVRLLTKQKADGRAANVAVLLANGRGDLLQIDARDLAEFREWRQRTLRAPTFGEVVSEFIAAKLEDKNLHGGYVKTLEYNLAPFCDAIGRENIAEIDGELPQILRGLNRKPRTRNNIRDALCAAFRFARGRGYLPDGITAAEKIKRIKLERSSEISIYSPEQMRAMLDECRPQYIPAETISAFAGIRSEEIRPKPNTHKDPLRWEDFNWDENYINIRDETSKTGIGRHAPFLPILQAWLRPWRTACGPVMPHDPLWERKRIATKTGIPRLHNARRHAFGTYRNSIIQNIYQLAEEMGNTPYICRSRYVRPRARHLADQWFTNLMPAEQEFAKILKFG
jgi:integrase